MTREARNILPPGVYHVSTRSIAGRAIYLDDQDRMDFLRLLGCATYRFRWICIGYCLMDTHSHLLIDTSVVNLSAGMKVLSGTYGQRFNLRHHRTGPLIRGRFTAKHIDNEYRFLNALKYVARNPVDAGMVEHPGDWPWSSYNATAGILPAPAFLDARPALALFSPDIGRARNAYIDFVNGDSPEMVRSRYYSPEQVPTSKVRERRRPPLLELLDGRETKESRDRAISEAYLVFGYTLNEIGEFLGLHESTICKIAAEHKRGRRC